MQFRTLPFLLLTVFLGALVSSAPFRLEAVLSDISTISDVLALVGEVSSYGGSLLQSLALVAGVNTLEDSLKTTAAAAGVASDSDSDADAEPTAADDSPDANGPPVELSEDYSDSIANAIMVLTSNVITLLLELGVRVRRLFPCRLLR
jgi:hypothetical protein